MHIHAYFLQIKPKVSIKSLPQAKTYRNSPTYGF